MADRAVFRQFAREPAVVSPRPGPTQLVMYPREGHGISVNVHGLDFINRFLDWFDTHVK